MAEVDEDRRAGRRPVQFGQRHHRHIDRKPGDLFAFGKNPSFIREGGSIGAVLSMQQAWKCPVVMMGLSLPEHGYHAINENFDWGQASGGMRAFVKYFDSVAKIR